MAESSVTPRVEYPVKFSVDYPDRPLNRLTSFFRMFTIIPIAIILGLLVAGGGGNWGGWSGWPGHMTGGWLEGAGQMGQGWPSGWTGLASISTVAGVFFLPTLLMILFRQKYPRWWYDWNINITKFCLRVGVYGALLRDEYPSTDEEQAVHLDIPYPDVKVLSRGMPLVKWFLAIPHYIVLIALGIATAICVIIAWFAILFTGNYPKSLFSFVVDVERWGLRVMAYAFLLTTDRYPPFKFDA